MVSDGADDKADDEVRGWRRRRRERAITRLTVRMAAVRDEIDLLRAQAGVLAEDADRAATDAVVRPGGPNDREAGRATSAAENHRRILAEHHATLDDLRRRRDALLDGL